MKKKLIKDNTFETYIRLLWDCSEEEFVAYWNKNFDFQIEVTGAFGINSQSVEGKRVYNWVWINRNNNIETLSHELIHCVRFWLQDYHDISLNQDTEEIYTMLHSFYMRECLKALKLEKLTAK